MHKGKLWWCIFKGNKAKPLQQPRWMFMVGDGSETPSSCESEQGFKMLLWTLEHASHDQFRFYIDVSQINTRVTLCSHIGNPNPAKNMRFCVILNILFLMHFDPWRSCLGWSILLDSDQKAVFWICYQRKCCFFLARLTSMDIKCRLWEKWRGRQTCHHITRATCFTACKWYEFWVHFIQPKQIKWL